MDALAELTVYNLDDDEYFNLMDLKEVELIKNVTGVKATTDTMTKRMKIPENQIVSAKRTATKLKRVGKDEAKSRYVRKGWAIKYVQTLEKEEEEELVDEVQDNDYVIEERVEIERVVEDAPEPIILNRKEKLVFGGALVDMDIRGSRDVDGCFYLFDDVADFLGIKDPSDVLRRQKNNGNFMFGYEYVKFRVLTKVKGRRVTQVKTYLTFEGMLRCSALKKTDRCFAMFRWAARKLFVVAMGSPDARIKMAAEITGVGLTQAFKLLSSSPTIFEGLYSFVISRNIKAVAKHYKIVHLIKDGTVLATDVLIKVGRAAKHKDTVDKGLNYGIARRFGEHIAKIECVDGVDTEIISFGVIQDRKYKDAEGEAIELIKEMARDVKFPGHREFFFLPEEKLEEFKKGLIKIIKDHEVTYDELFIGINSRDRKIELLNKDIENLKEKAANERRRRKRAEERAEEQAERIEEQVERIEEQAERIDELRAMNKILRDSLTEKTKTIKKLRARLE